MRKIKRIALFAVALAASLTWNSQAEVIVKKFDPPFQTGDSVFAGENSVYSSLHILINSTGTADFEIPYSFSKISFNSPAEIIVGKEELWDTRLIGGLAFGSTIGENIVEYEGNGHVWSSEVQTGQDIYFPATLIQSVIPLSLGAEPTSVDYVGGYVSEIRGREGIIGFKFQHEDPYGGYTMHYGYFHFNFSDSQEFMGEKGYLLGWAYETEPNKPIIAKPLNSLSETASPVSDFTYEIQEGQVTITGYTGSDEHVVIPSEIEGLPVTELGRRAFRENMQVKSFVLPDSLKRIGDHCFRLCENLETIEIPAQVEKINDFAFAGCLRLSQVSLPASVTEMGAFVFLYCPELIEISVSEDNPNYSSRDGVLFDKEQTTLIRYPSNQVTVEYTIPETVKKITDRAFDYCQNLETVVIPAGLTTIDPGAFAWCYSLQKIDIPNTVTNIGFYAFNLCPQLKEVNIGNGVTHIENGAFQSCPQLREITIPDNVLSLGDSSFLNCAGLETVRIGNGVTEIKGNMFAHCPQLKEVSMGNDVTIIGGRAFYDCISLINLNIGNNVTRIEDYAFYGCTNLQEIVLPDPLTSIGNMAFRDCASLTNMVIPDSVLFIGNDAFNGCLSLKNVVIGDGISNFLNRTFAGCINLETVRLGSGLTSPGYDTFAECLKLKWMDVSPDSPFLSSIDGILFDKTMSQLVFYPPNYPNTEYTVPDGVKEVRGFGQCVNLKRVTLPASVEKISSFSQSVTDVYFKGNAPGTFGYIPNYFTIHYLKGTVGWTKSKLSWLQLFTLETWTLSGDEPELFVSKRVIRGNEIEMTLVFGGALESSTNLKDWVPLETTSPYLVSSSVEKSKFYRTVAFPATP